METVSLRVIFVSLGSQGFLHLAGPVFSRPVFLGSCFCSTRLRAKFQGKHTCSGLLQLEAGSADSSTGAGLRDEHFSSRIFSWEPCLHFTAITTKNGTFGFPRQAFQQQDFSHRSLHSLRSHVCRKEHAGFHGERASRRIFFVGTF